MRIDKALSYRESHEKGRPYRRRIHPPQRRQRGCLATVQAALFRKGGGEHGKCAGIDDTAKGVPGQL